MVAIKKNYFRKVAFGIGSDQSVPSDPLAWAKTQVQEVPSLAWDGPLPTGSEMMDHRAAYRGNEDKLREKYKNYWKGRKQSEDHKRKKSEAMKVYHKKLKEREADERST